MSFRHPSSCHTWWISHICNSNRTKKYCLFSLPPSHFAKPDVKTPSLFDCLLHFFFCHPDTLSRIYVGQLSTAAFVWINEVILAKRKRWLRGSLSWAGEFRLHFTKLLRAVNGVLYCKENKLNIHQLITLNIPSAPGNLLSGHVGPSPVLGASAFLFIF